MIGTTHSSISLTTTAALLPVAFTTERSNAETVTFDPPLLANIYFREECQGDPDTSGTITSVAVLGEGSFCKCSADGCIILENNGCTENASGWEVSFTRYACYDNACRDCNRDKNATFVMGPPEFDALPAAGSCWWEYENQYGGFNTFASFDASADPEAVDAYWQIHRDNSCMRDMESPKEPSLVLESLAVTPAVSTHLVIPFLISFYFVFGSLGACR